MHRLLCPTWLLFVVCVGYSQAAGVCQESDRTFLVGVAKQDVTPAYPVLLNGFAARKEPSNGVTQRLWARALAIREADGEPVVLVTLDNLGIRTSMIDEVFERINKEVEIDRERLIVTFTHTHSAPKVNGASDNIFGQPISAEDQRQIDRYTAELTQKLSELVVAALQEMQPATLEWGNGQVEFAKNRRTPGGPTDHVLPVLIVRSANESRDIRAIYTTYACHCVTLSDRKLNGDWAGYAVVSIERHFPDAIGMVSIGCGSDQNPESGVTGNNVEAARHQGLQIGDEIARLIRENRLTSINGSLSLQSSQLELAFDELPTTAEYKAIRDAGGAAGYNAQTQLAKLESGETLPTFLPYPMQVLCFGDDLCMVFLAGEVCVDYSLRIRRELNGSKLWMHGYSNDFGAYIPSERLLREGGYGAGAEIPYFALPTKLKAGLEQQIVDEVYRLVPPAFDVPAGTDGVPPSPPHVSLRLMDTHDELTIQLVACEPQVSDPVAIDFGLQGELWVVQMSDYGHGVNEEFQPTGEVRRLRDEDKDGFFEAAEVFVSGLRFPTDVKVWQGGVLVCDAPDLLYFEDTDNDGHADVRRVLFTGFATHNGQARVNSLRWGLDNWVHGSCGLFGGQITSRSGRTVDLTQQDFRVRPDTEALQPVTGRTQQGRDRDDFGNWFGCDNGTLIRHYVVDDRYVRRNPFVSPPPTSLYVPSGENASRLFPSSELVLFKLSGGGGRATSACGLGIYRDTRMGEEYYGNSFTCEPVNQLIYRQVLTEHDGFIRGRRGDNEFDRDFVTSRDKWFRPVQVRTGPDGGLWIVDMYRYVIEHPVWIPEERKQELDLFAGKGMGRIYRILSASGEREPAINLADRANLELVSLIDHENGPIRDLAHQLLVWRRAQRAEDAAEVQLGLEKIVENGTIPAARVQALALLRGLDQLTERTCLAAIGDSDSRVRRAAIQCAEPLLRTSKALSNAVLELSRDDEFAVRLQVAYSLGEIRDVDVGSTWKRLSESSQHEYLRYALLSSLNSDNLSEISGLLLRDADSRRNISERFVRTAAELADEEDARTLLSGVLRASDESFEWRVSRLVAILNVLDRKGLRCPDLGTETLDVAAKLVEFSRRVLEDKGRFDANRRASIDLLGRQWGAASNQLLGADRQSHHELISEWISPLRSTEAQQVAIEGLTRRGEPQGAKFLLSSLPTATPIVRGAIVDAFLKRTNWTPLVWPAIEQGKLMTSDLDTAQRQFLATRLDEEERARLLGLDNGKHASDSRADLIDQYTDVATMQGDQSAGRRLFRKHCATCHRLEEFGTATGPNLAALTTRTTRFMLESILDPNRAVDGRYLSYVAITKDGLSVSGMLVEETSADVTIVDQQGRRHAILRGNIDTLQSTGKSAMPEGFEKDIPVAAMANLLAYLHEAGPPSKVFKGNQPRIIEPNEKGNIELPADAAAIFGDQIVFESQSPFKNIGYWHSGADHVVWNVLVPEAGQYVVSLIYSCDDRSDGNEFWIDGISQPLMFRVKGTGGWDRYEQVHLGSLQLDAGRTKLVARGSDNFQGPALLDLRAVVLTRSNPQD